MPKQRRGSKRHGPSNKPHIYHTNPTTERLWRQTLQQVSLSLVSILINHHASIVHETTTSLQKLEQQMRTKLEGHPEHKETWNTKALEALQVVNKLSEELKASRESRLNPTRKRTSQECGLDERIQLMDNPHLIINKADKGN